MRQPLSFNHLSHFCSIVSHHRILAEAERQSWYSQPHIILQLHRRGGGQTLLYTSTHIITSGVEEMACTVARPCLTSAVTLLLGLKHCLFLATLLEYLTQWDESVVGIQTVDHNQGMTVRTFQAKIQNTYSIVLFTHLDSFRKVNCLLSDILEPASGAYST